MKKIFYSLIVFLIPNIAYGFGISIGISFGFGSCTRNPQNLNDLICLFLTIISSLIPILIGLAILVFVWGLLRYYMSDNQNTKKEAVKIIGYGIIAIFVMVSVWGLVNILANTIGVNSGGSFWNPNNTLPAKQIRI